MSPEAMVFVGTYTTRGRGDGIYVYNMAQTTGELTFLNKAADVVNPSYLTVDPSRQYLFSVNETREPDGVLGGSVSAFEIDRKTGSLTLLNQRSSLGGDPCYVTVDKMGRYILVANYSSGNLAVLPVERNGELGPTVDYVQHLGSSINPQRQQSPHAHSIVVDPTNKYVVATDLGTDKVMIYRFDSATGRLEPNDMPWVKTRAGSGPRHFIFHPSGKYAYLITELDSKIVAYTYDADKGHLRELQTVSALPEGFIGMGQCADIQMTPSGNFLYGSNRGDNSIAIYAIEQSTGRLRYVNHESTQGKTPRSFVITQTGNLLLAANQNTDTIVPFRIDRETGRLTATEKIMEAPTPVCLKLISI